MTLLLLVIVASLLIIAFSEYLGERLGVVAPVILLAVGIGVGSLPHVPAIEVPPEILIEAILPPLLFSAAVQMPTQDFRRNLGTISSLSIALVVISSLVVGYLLHLLLGLGFATSIALGAIMSPTDAVATGIIKHQGVSRRVVTILEGEGLMNDAAALVVLRAAVAAIALNVPLGNVLANFIWSVLGALIIGGLVGHASIWLRQHVRQEHSSTIIAFTVPFLASIPTEHIGASGLVAAVAAGLVTSHHNALAISPTARNAAAQTWGTIGLVLESAVFLLMGLQLPGLADRFVREEETWTFVCLVAVICLVAMLVTRALIVCVTVRWMNAAVQRRIQFVPRAEQFTESIVSARSNEHPIIIRGHRVSDERAEQLASRVERSLHDIGYYTADPLGLRECGVITWAGMRGAVTLAAAQTLPLWLADRGLYLVLAFVVAAFSLVFQGVSLPWALKIMRPALAVPVSTADIRAIRAKLHDAAEHVPVPMELEVLLGHVHPETLWRQLVQWQHSHTPLGDAEDDPREVAELQRVKVLTIRYAITLIEAQRVALVELRDSGKVEADLYEHALKILDSDQLRLEIHLSAALAGVEEAVEDPLT